MLIVARHGRTAANAAGELLGRRDPPLDRVGRAQAAALGAELAGAARVVTSPLARTRETAAAIRAEAEVDERLIELDYGALEGVPVAEVPEETWAAWRADTAWRPPGGESLEELGVRVGAALDDLAGDAATRDVVVVTHVSPVKAAVAWTLGTGIEVQWRCFVQQASITRIATHSGRPSLHSFNDTHHLAGVE